MRNLRAHYAERVRQERLFMTSVRFPSSIGVCLLLECIGTGHLQTGDLRFLFIGIGIIPDALNDIRFSQMIVYSILSDILSILSILHILSLSIWMHNPYLPAIIV
ncbi:hypothetical protein CEXT_11401 [Caerostris extrusa]|uniref:Uncharacterized protein n=1 Tax=Caerostris extrusa TaxID=172846 RepID=A0AAV4NIT8_CAEEX|nr:hypothetical protein CEXT_11401 [Caerostris extrusa]